MSTEIDKSLIKAGDRIKVEVRDGGRKPYFIEGEVEQPYGDLIIGWRPIDGNHVHVIEHSPAWTEPDGWRDWEWLAITRPDEPTRFVASNALGFGSRWALGPKSEKHAYGDAELLGRFGYAPYVWSEADGPQVRTAR